MFNLISKRDAKIQEWEKVKKQLEQVKELEMKLRNEVLDIAFGEDRIDREGTENIELGAGYKLKAVFKQSRTMSTAKGRVDKVLDEIEAMGEEGKFIADRLVSWKPSLVKKEYDALPLKFKKVMDEIVTTKPASPTLEIIAPKSI